MDTLKEKWILILGAVAVALILAGGIGLSIFTTYKNRWGSRFVLLRTLKEKFDLLKLGCASAGIDIDMTDGWRGEKDQEAAFSSGASKAHFGESAHNYGAAFDVVPVENNRPVWETDSWSTIGDVGQALGLQWGGAFSTIVDKPHFNIPNWQRAGYELQPTEPVV